MKAESIERAQRVMAMLNVLQSEIDELAEDNMFFRMGIKYKGKAFAEELEKQIKEFYDAMDYDANVYYNKYLISLEELLKEYTQIPASEV